MPTSGIYTLTIPRDTLVRNAVLNMGKLGSTGVVTPQEQIDIALKLNLIVKQWQGKKDFAPGLKMWTRQRADLFLSAVQGVYQVGPSGDQWAGGVTKIPRANFGIDQLILPTLAGSAVLTVGVGSTGNFTAADYAVIQLDSGDIFTTTILSINSGAGTVTLNAVLPSQASANNFFWNYTTKGQRPEELLTCILRDSNQNDTPLDRMTLEVYEALPSKASVEFVSDPSAFYYESDLPNGSLYLDIGGVQDVTKQLHVVYLRPLQTFVNPTDEIDFPAEWGKPLEWQLTKDCCPMFNGNWGTREQSILDEALAIARHADAETSQLFFNCNEDRM